MSDTIGKFVAKLDQMADRAHQVYDSERTRLRVNEQIVKYNELVADYNKLVAENHALDLWRVINYQSYERAGEMLRTIAKEGKVILNRDVIMAIWGMARYLAFRHMREQLQTMRDVKPATYEEIRVAEQENRAQVAQYWTAARFPAGTFERMIEFWLPLSCN